MHTTSKKSVLETHGNTIHWAGHYDRLVKLMLLGRDKKLRETTVNLAGVKAGDHVLEVGCGTGEVSLVAQKRVGTAGKVYGIDASPSTVGTPPSPAFPQPLAPSGGASQSLAEVLRFDVSPRWVTDRWPRVSTVHVQPDLEGLRVPLVTGTMASDLLGSLTYYFDRQQRVRRITLHGHTGDERMLVTLRDRLTPQRQHA